MSNSSRGNPSSPKNTDKKTSAFKHPEGSGPRFTGFFLPKGFGARPRLEHGGADLWNALVRAVRWWVTIRAPSAPAIDREAKMTETHVGGCLCGAATSAPSSAQRLVHAGGNLSWRQSGSGDLSIMAGTLDAPTGLAITAHLFVADKSGYYRLQDDVPQRQGGT